MLVVVKQIGINWDVFSDQCRLYQGFSNFWSYGAHEEIDLNLRSPTINFINVVIACLDSCKIIQVSILMSKPVFFLSFQKGVVVEL